LHTNFYPLSLVQLHVILSEHTWATKTALFGRAGEGFFTSVHCTGSPTKKMTVLVGRWLT